MLKSSALLLCAVLMACSGGSTAPAAAKPSPTQTPAASAPAETPSATASSNGTVPQKLAELSGSGATDCGVVKTLAADEIQKASDCAMTSAKAKKPFRVEYDMPGLLVGVAANSAGKLYAVQSAETNGKAGEAKATDCPAELRVAQSGRVTCMPPANMGVTPGAANPHATGGASPHGGMGTPPAGTPNPHAGGIPAPKKSH